MNKQQHRDRVNELKGKIDDFKFQITILITSFLTLMSISYIVYYNIKDHHALVFLIVVVIYFMYKFPLEVNNKITEIKTYSKMITRNYDVLLDRKK